MEGMIALVRSADAIFVVHGPKQDAVVKSGCPHRRKSEREVRDEIAGFNRSQKFARLVGRLLLNLTTDYLPPLYYG